MRYKALMLDIDETIIPNQETDILPSERVAQAINLASKNLHVGVVTGRPHFTAQHIISHLNLTGPSIFSGGCQIIDTSSQKVLWKRLLSRETANNIASFLKKKQLPFLLETSTHDLDSEKGSIVLNDCISFAIKPRSDKSADEIINELTPFSEISAHKVTGWDKGTSWIHINHAEGTKQHGILAVAEILAIDTKEIIGVGDGYNDFPLLMACGLKVAMGNAHPELKAIADYVAPSVEEDGVADVIEKFILKA